MENQQKLTKAQKRELRKIEWQQEAVKAQKMQQYKKIGLWTGVGVVIVLAILGLAFVVNSPSSSSTTSGITVPAKADKEFSKGDPKSKVTLIEYGDFQCPACAQYHPMVKKLLEEEGNKLHFVYRYFPLINAHQNARISAQAGYAAYKEGKFWEMFDVLYENQNDWAQAIDPQSVFVSYAQKIGLNTNKFLTDLKLNETSKFIDDSLNAATTLGLQSTPSFFINGQKIENPNTYEDFKKLVDDQFNK